MTGHRLVFVGGLHPSGTTPLTRCLAAHPEISGFAGTGVAEDEASTSRRSTRRPWPTAGRAGSSLRPAAHLTERSALLTPDTGARPARAVAAPLGT